MNNFVKLNLFQKNQCQDGLYSLDLNATNKEPPFETILQNGFGFGSVLEASACIHDDADR